MSQRGLQTDPFTPIFGAPSTAGLRAPAPATSPLTGFESLQPTGADEAIKRLQTFASELNIAPPSQAPAPAAEPYIAFSPSRNELYVNGFAFREDDAEAALRSESYLGQAAARPEEGDWEPIPASVYQDYLQSIKDPTLGRRFARSAAGGFGSLQEMWGAALMLGTDGAVGRGVYEVGQERARRNAPFMKPFTEIKDADDALDWFASTVGQATPFLAESILSGIAGAIAGGAVGSATAPGAGTVAGAVGGAVAGTVGREAVKVTLKQAVAKKFKGEVLTKNEHMYLSRAAGAMLGTTASGYVTGTGDVRAEQMERGVADEPGAGAAAAALGVPYALLNSATELGTGWLLFRQGARAANRTALETAGTYAGRFGAGLTVGGAAEGLSEVGQEALVVAGSEQLGAEYSDAEKATRWIEAFAGGAAVGGPVGGGVNLLRPRTKPEAPAAPAPAAPTEPTPEGPTLADVGDLPRPPRPESILGTPGLRPPPPEAPPASLYDETGATSGYMGGLMMDIDEPVGAPPVLPGQENMLFQDTDLGPVVSAPQPVAQPEPVAEGQQALFTQRGQPTAAAAQGAGFGATIALKPEQRRSLNWLVKNGKEQFPPQAATNLGSASNVVIQANDFNIKKLLTDGADSVVKVSFFGRKNPVTVAYDEAAYGSPQQFAEAMGFDYAMLDTGTFTRTTSDGAVSAELPITEYAAPVAPMTRPELETRAATRAAAKTGAAPKAGKVKRGPAAQAIRTAAEGATDAVQERSPTPMDVREQAGTREGVSEGDTTKREAPGKGIRKKKQAEEPAGVKAARPEPEGKEETPAGKPLTVNKVGKSEEGYTPVTLSDGTTTRMFYDRDGAGLSGWYLDEGALYGSKNLPTKPGYVQPWLGSNKDEALGNLPARLQSAREKEAAAKPEAPKSLKKATKTEEEIVPKIAARKRAEKAAKDKAEADLKKAMEIAEGDLTKVPAADIIDELSALDTAGQKHVPLIVELFRRVDGDIGTEAELAAISDLLIALSQATSTYKAYNQAAKQLDKALVPAPTKGAFNVAPFVPKEGMPEVLRRYPIDVRNITDTKFNEIYQRYVAANEAAVKANLFARAKLLDNLAPDEVAQVMDQMDVILQLNSELDQRLQEMQEANTKARQKDGSLKFKPDEVVFVNSRLLQSRGPFLIEQVFAHPHIENVFGYVVFDPATNDTKLLLSGTSAFDQLAKVTEQNSDYGTYASMVDLAKDTVTRRQAMLSSFKDAQTPVVPFEKQVMDKLDQLAKDNNLVRTDRVLLPVHAEPVSYVGPYFQNAGNFGYAFETREGRRFTVKVPMTTTIEGMDAATMFRTMRVFKGPTGRFSKTGAPIGGSATSVVKTAIDAVMSKVSAALKSATTVHVYANQGDLLRKNPALYREAAMTRLRDVEVHEREAAANFEEWFDSLPTDVKADPAMRSAALALYDDVISGEGKFLLNPTPEQAVTYNTRRMNSPGFTKFIRTKYGNVIGFHTSDLGEHADAAIDFGLKEGEFDRGRLNGKDADAWFDTPAKRRISNRVERVTAADLIEANEYAKMQWDDMQNARFMFGETDSAMAGTARMNKVLMDIMIAQSNAKVVSDFDTTRAAGFYFRDRKGNANVIVFSDNIENTDHALRVFAEEMVGHNGLRELLGDKNMQPIMQEIYDNSPSVRAAADAYAQQNRGVSISEAVEEVLVKKIADEIAMENGANAVHADPLFVEQSVFTKAINAIKKLLNRLFGKRALFDDEDVRQLLADTKRFVKTGDKAVSGRTHFNLQRIVTAPDSTAEGRFSGTRPLGGGPTRAEKLPPAYYQVLGETMAETYELAHNGASNEFIADNLGYAHTNSVSATLSTARAKLRAANLPDLAGRQSLVSSGKYARIMKLAAKRDADGNLLTVAKMAERLDMTPAGVSLALKRERDRLTAAGRPVPDYLIRSKGRGGRFSVAPRGTFEYGQAAGPLYTPYRPIPRELEGALDWLRERRTNMGQLGRDVLNAVKTMNFSSRSNAGYREGYRILTDTKNTISRLRSKYNALLEDVLSNADQNIRLEVSKVLQFTAQAKLSGLTDKRLRELPKLFRVVGNEIVVDPAAFETLSKMGRFTLDELRAGVSREVDVAYIENDEVATRRETITLEAMPNLTEDSQTWKLYVQARDAMDEAALDRARADYAAAFGARENTFRKIEDTTGRKLTQADREFVETVERRYRELAKEGATENADGKLEFKLKSLDAANEFMADFNRVLIARTEDKGLIRTFADKFPAAQQADAAAAITEFRKGMTFTESSKFEVQRVVSDLAALELGKEDSELYAKRSIAGGYVPIGRKGSWQVRVRVVDPVTGQVFGLMDSFRAQLPYFQMETRGEADTMMAEVNKLFPPGQTTMELPVFDPNTKQYTLKKVRLEAVAEAARETPTSDPGINMNEFMRLITRFGVSLTPQERERIVIGMTEQNARARTNLQRQNVPGQDPDSVPYISQHLESLSNITGRRMHQHRIDILMDENDPRSQRMWNGDPAQLARLKAVYEAAKADPMSPQASVELAKRELDEYAFMLRRTKEEGGGNAFKDRFVRDLAFLETQKALDYADFASDGIGQTVRTWTAVAQLGGSFATGALNIVSLALNVVPALASYNAANGFGGGFGMGRSAAAISAALKDVGGLGKYRETYYKDLLKDKDALAKSGLTRDEAEFLAREIEFGNLQAALANALTASAKGRFGRNPTTQKFIDAYMSAFTYTEQASRRASALAAYRLERDRQLDAGVAPEVAYRNAEQFSLELSNNALGNYSMYNRPGGFRGGLRDFIFMYKMYPITTVQLLSALDMKGKALMLTALWLTSGLKGMPFAEDIMDLLDTIMQKLGLKAASVEALAAQTLDEIAPGLAPVVLKGVVDQMIPATISSRTGLGNLIPGTSMFVAGANQFNEAMDFLGPAAGAVEATLATAGATTQGALGLVGLSDRSSSLENILRGSPVTMMRSAGDMLAYYETNAIVDSKGYVASRELDAGTYLARALGFYPAAASRQNDVVRLTKRQADYMREVSGEFRRAYVKAALRDDRDKMRQVAESVRDWNREARGTGLEIPNFTINAQRAVQEARKTSSERYISSAPKSLRREVQGLQETYGADE